MAHKPRKQPISRSREPKNPRDHAPDPLTLMALRKHFGPLEWVHRGENYLEGDGVRIYVTKRNGQVSLGRAKVVWTEMNGSLGYLGIGEPDGVRIYLIEIEQLLGRVNYTGNNGNELRFRAKWSPEGCRASIGDEEIPGTLLDPIGMISEWSGRDEASYRATGRQRVDSQRDAEVEGPDEKAQVSAESYKEAFGIPEHLLPHAYYMQKRMGGYLSVAVDLRDGKIALRKGSVARAASARVKRPKAFFEWRKQHLSKLAPLPKEKNLFELTEDVIAPDWYYAARFFDPDATQKSVRICWIPLTELIDGREQIDFVPPQDSGGKGIQSQDDGPEREG